MNTGDTQDIVVRWAHEAWEIEGALALRRKVFCDEQGVFEHDDRDAIDTHAQLIVAVCAAKVIGTVRIHRRDADHRSNNRGNIWYGSRLAVCEAYRRHGGIGATLIRLAVSSAHAQGCEGFLAQVQAQNAPLFQRLHWRTLEETMVFGRPHHLMQADLEHYPPCATPYEGFVVDQRRAA